MKYMDRIFTWIGVSAAIYGLGLLLISSETKDAMVFVLVGLTLVIINRRNELRSLFK